MSELTAMAWIGLEGPSEPVVYKSTTAAEPDLIASILDHARSWRWSRCSLGGTLLARRHRDVGNDAC